MKKLAAIVLTLCLFSCESNKKINVEVTEEVSVEAPKHPELLTKFLEAHGGLDRWNSFGTLEYDIDGTLGRVKKEHQVIDLHTRKVLIEGDSFKIGMNGQEVWVTPSKETFGSMSPRFYHNLFFYFFSIPHVLADLGAIYEDMGEQTINDKTYRALKVSFDGNIGDAPDDFYIAHLDPETYQLEVLLYTVTYFSGEKSQRFNSLVYDKWQEVDGLIVPQYMAGYKFEDGKTGDLRYESTFSNVTFKENTPNSSLFDIPEGALIDSLITH